MNPYGMGAALPLTVAPTHSEGVVQIGTVMTVSDPEVISRPSQLQSLVYGKLLDALALYAPPNGMEITHRGKIIIDTRYPGSQYEDPLAQDLMVYAKQEVTLKKKPPPKPQPYVKGVYQP